MRIRINKVLAIITFLFLTALLAKWAGLWGYHYAAGRTPPFGLNPGQKFFSVGCCYSIYKDDLILYSDGKRDYVRRVLEIVNDEQIRVQKPGGGDLIVDEQDIIGKVVYRF